MDITVVNRFLSLEVLAKGDAHSKNFFKYIFKLHFISQQYAEYGFMMLMLTQEVPFHCFH